MLNKKIGKEVGLSFLFVILGQGVVAHAVDKALENGMTPATNFQVSAKTKFSQIQALPDSTMVKMPDGNEARAGNLKALAKFIKMAKAQKGSVKPTAQFAKPQGMAQLQISKGANFHMLMQRKDSDVLQLPSGRKLTVGDYKKIDQFAKMMTGRGITERQAAPPSTSGPAIKIKSKSDFDALKDKPDSTVLEGPLGKRITLGELRAYAKKNNKPVGVR